MIHDSIEFHNVGDLRPQGNGGLRLQRVPEAVRQNLEAGAREKVLSPANCEIRFYCHEDPVEITLSGPEGGYVMLYHGPFQGEALYLSPEPRTFTISQHERLLDAPEDVFAGQVFSPRIARLICWRPQVCYHGVSGKDLRPPHPDELPRLRLLTYGTSITHGAAASDAQLSYAGQAARRLGADLLNFGVGGSALCEHAFADYMATVDWNVASLALSVNMIGHGFSIPDFSERVRYMVNTIAGAHPEAPVACITIYPFLRDMLEQRGAQTTPKVEEYRQALRDAVADCPHDNAFVVEGPDILRDIGGLSADMIHPGDHGMIEMGQNLAAVLAGRLG